MVSLSDLLAVVVKSDEHQASAAAQPPPLADILLPPVRPVRSTPYLRYVLRELGEATGTSPTSPPQTPTAGTLARPSRRGNQTLPLQRLLGDLGPEATDPTNMLSLASTLAHFGRPSEAAVASALLFLTTRCPKETGTVDSRTLFELFTLFCADPENPALHPAVQRAVSSSSTAATSWRPDVLVQAVCTVATQFNAPIDWRLVVRSLDVSGLEKRLSQSAFVEIARAYVSGSGGTILPADCVLDAWVHRSAQLCIISRALASPDCIDWNVLDPFEGATEKDVASPCSRVALIEKLVELNAAELLDMLVGKEPDLVLLSLTSANPRNNSSVQQKLIVKLLNPLISSFPRNEKTLRQMWAVAPDLVESAIRSQWKADSATLKVALVIAMRLGVMNELLNSGTSIEFSVELAMLAYLEGIHNLEKWLLECLRSRGPDAITKIATHLTTKAQAVGGNAISCFSLDAVRVVLRCLLSCVVRKSEDLEYHEALAAVSECHQALTHVNPRIGDPLGTSDIGDRKVLVGSMLAGNVGAGNRVRTETSASPPITTDERVSDAAATATVLCMSAPLPSTTGPVSFPSEIEREASLFFENLYTLEIPTEKAVEALRALKDCGSEYRSRLFYCMMYSLFDEYRFFKKYPERELEMTGHLFGAIVKENILPPELQGLAVRVVLDSLKAVEAHPGHVGRLALFGMFALERFVECLKEMPYFCSEVVKIPRLAEIRPFIIGEVRRALEIYRGPVPSTTEKAIGIGIGQVENSDRELTSEGAAPPAAVRDTSADAKAVIQLTASPPALTDGLPVRDISFASGLRPSPSMSLDGSLMASPTNLTVLLGMTVEEARQVVAPDVTIQDKIKFIFNNLSHSTMDDKVKEILEILDAQYHRFFCVYVVVKRASSETNFHHLYLTLLERMASEVPFLFPMVFDTSYKRIRVLLRSEKIVSIPTERMVLKSLGSWIGALTLARNQPILRRDLDLKELLMDAYSKGRLIAVVPFVSKVLESSQRSRVFKTTNPWIRGLLNLMKEIYCVPDLKLNMKFELQLLCKSLNIDVQDVLPSDLLRDRPAPDKNSNADFNIKKPANASPIRSSPSPATSPSPDLHLTYAQTGAGSRVGIPMFSLADAQASTSALPPVTTSGGHGATSGRFDATGNVMSGNIVIGQDSVEDLSSILVSASIPVGGTGTAQIPRSTLQAGSSISSSTLQPSAASQRQGNALPAEPALVPNLAQYITISPTLVLFQTNPHLKRILPFAIDRAIKEIIQPVVERSCAIAFLTTKELTLKDFANESDTTKVRRAALQMVQQLAGSLALVTSKEPLRVSMGNQLRSILSPVAGDQTLVEQTSQVISAANLEVGCAVIERHAKEKAARDLNEKIAPAFASRRPQQSSHAIGLPPGPEVLRVYDEFSRIPRLGTTPLQQHTSGQRPVLAPSLSARLSVNPSHQGSAPSNARSHPSNGITPSTDHRQNDAPPGDTAVPEPRAGSLRLSRGKNTPIGPNERSLQAGSPGKRAFHRTNSLSDSRPSSALCGTVPTVMASAADFSSALLTAAGSPNGSSSNAHGSMTSGSASIVNVEDEVLSTQQVLIRFNSIYPRLTALVREIGSASTSEETVLSEVPADHDIHKLWVLIPSAVKRSVTADEAGMAVAQKVFKGLFEGEDSNLNREIHVLLLEGLRESCRRLSKELVSWLAYSEEHKKLHRECIVALLKPGSLLNITNYDELLSKTIDNGRNMNALEFACFLVRRAVIHEPLATAAELYLTLEAIGKVGRRTDAPSIRSAPEGLLALVLESRRVVHNPPEVVTGSNNNETHHSSGPKQHKEMVNVDPPGTRETVANCLSEWQRILVSDLPHRPAPDHLAMQFLSQIRGGLLATPEDIERVFRTTVDLVCSVTATALRSSRTGAPRDIASAPYSAVDSTVRLVGALCRTESDNASERSPRGVLLLNQFLFAVVKHVLKSSAGTDMRPHFRLFSGIIEELAVGLPIPDISGTQFGPLEPGGMPSTDWILPNLTNEAEAMQFLEDANSGFLHTARVIARTFPCEGCNLACMQVLGTLVVALSSCSPLIVPGFAFSWLQLISNKELMPRLLMSSNVQGGSMFLHLLTPVLRFMSTYLRDPLPSFTEGMRILYKGTLRVLLVLLHDFPEFLCDYHMAVVDVIPHNCVQLRNIVLASFPKSMRLPDPFLPELKVDQLPEMSLRPRILTKYLQHLEASGLKAVLDCFLQNASSGRNGPAPRLSSFVFSVRPGSSEKSYSVPTIGALVLYLGQYAVSQLQPGASPLVDNPVTDIVQSLTRELDPEGQYHLFNAIANQLRYPNCHTLYYSRLILSLFHGSSEESVKEQITRVLLERLIANRPHPWGLLVTFVELVKNSLYNFWDHAFVRCAPEIEELFENVAKVCIGPALQNQQSLSASS